MAPASPFPGACWRGTWVTTRTGGAQRSGWEQKIARLFGRQARAFLILDLPYGDVLAKQCSECFKQRRRNEIHLTTGTNCFAVFQHTVNNARYSFCSIRLHWARFKRQANTKNLFNWIQANSVWPYLLHLELWKGIRARKERRCVESSLPTTQFRMKFPRQLNLQGYFSPHAKGSPWAWLPLVTATLAVVKQELHSLTSGRTHCTHWAIGPIRTHSLSSEDDFKCNG